METMSDLTNEEAKVSLTDKRLASRPPRKPKKSSSSSIISSVLRLQALSVDAVALLACFIVLLLHLGALSLFTSGFLLKRTTLEPRNECNQASDVCTLEPKFTRAIILLVDALRYDFLFPVDSSSSRYDPFHHNHLTLPASLSKTNPRNALMYKAIADPPTTTLQRLKAITTGSLPTFVDAGSNFAGSRVDEDNWLDQAKRNGKRIAFMGDDTWLTIFPESVFAPNLSFPFDSFNVEDLDTVDSGVRQHLIPLLDEDRSDSSWDILIAHPLGLDHAGHRFGASHGQTTRKLQEVNMLISDIVKRLAENDLLVVMGDHGMDSKGDHGGDSPEEVESALWLYSKTPLVPDSPLSQRPWSMTSSTLEEVLISSASKDGLPEFFELDNQRHRTIPQISLVPTISLLLGLPIPLNNLGTLIPELFLEKNPLHVGNAPQTSSTRLMQALKANAHQIKTYLKNYAAHPSGSDLSPYIPDLIKLYDAARNADTDEDAFRLYRKFTYATLSATRNIWARFNPIAMLAGISVLLGSLLAIVRMYHLSQQEGTLWRTGPLRLALARSMLSGIAGLPLGLVAWFAMQAFDAKSLSLSQCILLSACLSAELSMILYTTPLQSTTSNLAAGQSEQWLGIILLILHTIGFASNSYILWEDWVVLFLGQVQPALLLLKAARAEDPKLRNRVIKLALLALASHRIMAFSSVCREEQHPYCTATFYGGSGVSISSPGSILAALLASLALPSVLGRFLDLSASRQGWAPFFLRYSFRGLLVGGVSYWAADNLEYSGTQVVAAQLFKTTMARVLMMFGIILGTTFWKSSPLCIDVQQSDLPSRDGENKKQVVVIGYANSIGSSYLMLYATLFGFLFITLQPVGQIVSCLAVLSLLSLVEAIDNDRDSTAVNTLLAKASAGKADIRETVAPPLRPPSFLSTGTIALWGYILFFATGHQAVLSAIQWKTAFIGFPVLTYPFSPILVILNTLGPFILSAAAIPLLTFWNIAPNFKGGDSMPVLSNLLTACLSFMIYHTTITLSSSIFAAYLRRHLMVWKVFAPRFMLSAMTLLITDITVLVICIGWGGLGTLKKVANSFGTVWR